MGAAWRTSHTVWLWISCVRYQRRSLSLSPSLSSQPPVPQLPPPPPPPLLPPLLLLPLLSRPAQLLSQHVQR
ncbi:hypothetical protein E2C01_076156 [Portunus trituberculatus]|uniref:Uncharacterized protein n=1 Tax=Portunus trituberculatus TaxID=210409 RepID=A0A5B7IMW8_PORTR|nr:hypothetical protein [Portunus trituberculatus]